VITTGEVLTIAAILGSGIKAGVTLDQILKEIPKLVPALAEAEYEVQKKLQQERLTVLKYRPKFYEAVAIDLSTARDKEKFDISGNYLIAQNIDGTLTVRFNEKDSDAVTVDKDNRFYALAFDCCYVTNEAQSGKSATLLIGKGDFAGSAITPVDISATSIEKIAIDIVAQTISNLAISVAAQSVGVYIQPEWAAKTGVDKVFNALQADMATGTYTFATYQVTAGKTLYMNYIAGWCVANLAADRDKNQIMAISIYDETAGQYLFACGGLGGATANLTKPIVIPAGHTVWFMTWNFANHNCDLRVSAGGYEV
jgi:hypothetical protein